MVDLYTRMFMDGHETHESSFKELPTREQKLRRHNDRRYSPPFPNAHHRMIHSTSPTHDRDGDRCFSDRSVSSSPEGVNLQLSANSAFTCYQPIMARNVPTSPVGSNNSYRGSPDPPTDNDDIGLDQPLDMSTKRNPIIQSPQQQRPSVITCASALLRTQCIVAPRSCSTVESTTTPDESLPSPTYVSDGSKSKTLVKHEDSRTGHRREVGTGSCDPVIDEHFRRSLGKDYQQIFSKSASNSVSITVDDHFAKALGDTWLQLQQSTASDATETTQQSQPQNLHSKQQSQFLKHSPEIVSS